MTYPDFKGLVGRMLGDKWPFWLSVHLLYYDRRTIVRQLAACGFQTDALMPYWPVLELGYIFQRAAVYVPPANLLRGLAKTTGLDRLLVAFNMSQTVVLAHKGKG
jgi:hypothetical protein